MNSPPGPYQLRTNHSWISFCPRCGGTLEERFLEGENRARQVCPSCGFIYYLNPKVVACAIPRDNGRIWLLKRNIEPGFGLWTFPGGYVDLGERVPDAAIRETMEEMSLEIRIDSLLNVYSYDGIGIVLVVYLATVTGGRASPTPESQEVRLFSLAELPWQDLAFPSTRDALAEYARFSGPYPPGEPGTAERVP
jgi:8-oxo-dGTP diphosphatase